MKKASLRLPLFLTLTLLIVFACIPPNSPKGIAKKFLYAVDGKDYDLAKAYATEETQTSLEMLQELNKKKETATLTKGEGKGIKIVKQTLSGNTAQVTYKDNGQLKTVDLKKQGDTWKVQMSKPQIEKVGEGEKETQTTPAKVSKRILKDPFKVGYNFLDAFLKGEYEEAKLYATESTQLVLDRFKVLGEEVNPEASFEILFVEEMETQATVHYKTEGKEKMLSLVKQGKYWKANMTKPSLSNSDSDQDMENMLKEIGESLQKALDSLETEDEWKD